MMRQYELVERVTSYKPNANEALLNKAYVYAMKKHGEQVRANGDPYFSHPLEVAAILTDLHLDEETIAVALLHDYFMLRFVKHNSWFHVIQPNQHFQFLFINFSYPETSRRMPE